MDTTTHHDDTLLAAIVDDPRPLAQIAASFGISLLDLIAWAEAPHTRRALDALQQLAEARLRLRNAPIRAAAIEALYRLLDSPGNAVEVRRIASTLIRATGGKTTPSARVSASTRPPPGAPDAAEPAPPPRTSTSTVAPPPSPLPIRASQPQRCAPVQPISLEPGPNPSLLPRSRATPAARLASRAGQAPHPPPS